MESIGVIGIDPGSRFTGWGVVREVSGVAELVDCGVIRAAARGDSGDFSCRLGIIFSELALILDRHAPAEAAIEQVFTAKSAPSALKLGQARGVAVAACASRNIKIFDYEPTLIKKSIVGAGRADKEQVAFMVKRLLNIPTTAWTLDTSDALAAALCHLSQRRFLAMAERATICGIR